MFQADPDNGFFADFPTLGVDSNAVYISGDFFSSSVSIGTGSGLHSQGQSGCRYANDQQSVLVWRDGRFRPRPGDATGDLF